MGQNMLFITGTNVERTSVKKYKLLINKDHDIKKLIRNGLFALKWRPLIGFTLTFLLLALFVLTNPFLSTDLSYGFIFNVNRWVQNIIPFEYNYIPLVGAIILVLITFISIIWDSKDYIAQFSKKIPAVKRALRFIFRAQVPNTPLELWDILQASIMDAQLTTSAERLFDTDVSLIYGGMPYYKLLLADKIYVKWEGLDGTPNFVIRHHFRRFFRKFSVTTILSEVEKKYFSKKSILQASNCVFGTLFLSEYIQSFIKYNKIRFKEKFSIDCSSILTNPTIISSNKKFSTNINSSTLAFHAAYELMGYATNPTFFTFNKDKSTGITLKICRIDFLEDPLTPKRKVRVLKGILSKKNGDNPFDEICNTMDKKEISRYCRKNGIIPIPIKKLLSIPFGQSDPENPLPPFILSPTKRLIKFNKILVLGGAEQNIVLSNIINAYKWRKDAERSNEANYHYFGFAENVFDACGLHLCGRSSAHSPGSIDFLVGTEGFVYGNWRFIRSKIHEEDDDIHEENQNMAEVFELKLKNTEYFFIYGYHALATKIATMKFFVYNESSNNDIRDQYLPDKRKHRITYQLNYPINPDFDGLRDFWDQEDPINSSKDALKEKLESIEVKI